MVLAAPAVLAEMSSRREAFVEGGLLMGKNRAEGWHLASPRESPRNEVFCRVKRADRILGREDEMPERTERRGEERKPGEGEEGGGRKKPSG